MSFPPIYMTFISNSANKSQTFISNSVENQFERRRIELEKNLMIEVKVFS